ncbi:MAG: hypothetical protein K6E16_08440 [Lachnospiraceae bacterium]|nr:hypothetical protein [Lachnospiraceae bacterium]
MKRTVAFLLAALMTCTTVLTAVPVNAAETANVQEAGISLEEKDQAEGNNATEDLIVHEAESSEGEEDLLHETEEIAESDELEAEAEDLPAEEEEELLETDGMDEAPAANEYDLGDNEYELPAEADAEFFEGKSTSAKYYLVQDTVITLADTDNITIGSILETSDSDYNLAICGNGQIHLDQISLGYSDKNSLTVEGCKITVRERMNPGKLFTMSGGELCAESGIQGKSMVITDGLLELKDYVSETLYLEGDLTVEGGTVNAFSSAYDAVTVWGDATFTGGRFSAVALAQGTTTGHPGISCYNTITISGNAVIDARGDIYAVSGRYGINGVDATETHKFEYPNDCKIAVKQQMYRTVDSDGNDVPAVRIVPKEYASELKTDMTVVDFGKASVGYDASHIAPINLVVTNKGNAPVTLIQPDLEKYTVTPSGSISNIPSGGSVTFSICPKEGIAKGKGNELLMFRTTDGASVTIPLVLRVGYFLSGNVQVSSLNVPGARTAKFELDGDTVIQLESNKTVTVNSIDCKDYNLTITGDDTGTLVISSSLALGPAGGTGTLTVSAGTLTAYTYGYGNQIIMINGGALTTTGAVSTQGKLLVSGGTLNINGGRADHYAVDVGEMEINNEGTVGINYTSTTGKAINIRSGDFSIINGKLDVKSSSEYGLYAQAGNIHFGESADVSLRGTAEAVALKLYGGDKKITIDDSLTVRKPSGGGVAKTGDHAGHITDSEGNIAKIVRIATGEVVSHLTASPATLDFGRVPFGYTTLPAAGTVMVTNTGDSAVSFIVPESDKYTITTTSTLTNVAKGQSVYFSIQPKIGIAAGTGAETVTIQTTDDQSVDVELSLDVAYLLTGEMEAADLVEGKGYIITGNTVLHIGAGVNKRISKIDWESRSSATLRITGDESGMLTVSNSIDSALADGANVAIEGGTLDCYSLQSYGNVMISGGKVIADTISSLGGNLTITGGTVSMTDSHAGKAILTGKNVSVSGGKVNINCTIPYPVMQANTHGSEDGKVTITGGELTLSSNKAEIIVAKNIEIGGTATLSAVTTATSADVKEAIRLTDYTTGAITIADSHMITTPDGGYLEKEGINAGHIVTAVGELTKSVTIAPKPEGMEETPAASIDENNNRFTGLVASAAYLIDGVEKTADENGCIEIPAATYGRVIKIVKVGSSPELNSVPQRIKVCGELPDAVALTMAEPLADEPAAGTIDTGSRYYVCDSLTWTPAVLSTGFVENTSYTATAVIKAQGALIFDEDITVSLNGDELTKDAIGTGFTLTDGGQTLTVTKAYGPTPRIVHVSGVQISPNQLILTEGGSPANVTVLIQPANADDKEYTLKLDGDAYVTLSNTEDAKIKTVAPKAVGAATITATTHEYEKTAVATVYVRYSAPAAEQKNTFLTGLVADAKYRITPQGGTADEFTASADGTIRMLDSWYNTTLSIVRVHSTYENCNSAEQSLVTVNKIPAEGFYAELKDEISEYTYTGSAVTPEVLVYYNRRLLTKDVDYTLKYAGNVNVTRDRRTGAVVSGAKVTVTGKGSLSGSDALSFTITPRSISGEAVTAGKITVSKNSTAKPVLAYGSYVLAAKDYTVDEPSKKYVNDGTMTVHGKGNFTGTRNIPVHVVDKKTDVKSLNVVVDTSKTLFYDPSLSEDDMRGRIAFLISVYDKKDTRKTKPLSKGTDYMIVFPDDVTNAGTKKINIIGLGDYTGSVTKSMTVKPFAVKNEEKDGKIITNAATIAANNTYPFAQGGVAIGNDLNVRFKDTANYTYPLTEGVDYKLTYTNNKAVSTDKKKATYTITFIGNYKGTPVLKNIAKKIDDYSFTIVPASLATNEGKAVEGVKVSIPDVIYAGKANLYASAPYVTLNGVTFTAANYTVKYYRNAERKPEDIIDKNHKLELAAGEDDADVYVTITGKGNYSGEIKADSANAVCSYQVVRADTNAGVYDLSKAKVTIYQKGYVQGAKNNKVLRSVPYNGKARRIDDPDIDGTIVVEYKIGKTTVTLKEGEDYKLTYLNNTEKGKAVILVEGTKTAHDGKTFAGMKSAGFTIDARSLNNAF